MWGGVKVRAQHGDIFRAWSASQGLEKLRRQLYREPRPWYLAWSLHHHRHLLSDYHCARLLSWCTTVMCLERRPPARQQAYLYAQQVFQVMVHSHKVGTETYQEFFRLCATGRDLTTAFRWQQYLVETDQTFPLSHYTWLLHIAALSPNDESAEDMAEAVWETYMARYCSVVKHDLTGNTAMVHHQPSTEEEARQLAGMFRAFKILRPRIADGAKSQLLQFIDSLPDDETMHSACGGWPTISQHHTFPHLESAMTWAPPTLSSPRLRDSILHEGLVADLEEATFAHNVQRVVAIVEEYRQRISAEKSGESATRHRAGERDIWRSYADPSVLAFRKELVEDGGVTSELYHYLIVALSLTQPSTALRTVRRMEEANLRVLDLTRAVMIVRCEGSSGEQMTLLQEQLREIEERQKIDVDYGITREVELFWKFQYADFFHYRNALNQVDLFRILMEGLGPVRVQQLLLDAQHHGTCSLVDVTVLNDSFRTAAAHHYRCVLGEKEVNRALDDITKHMPKLDISLVGSLQHFGDYALPAEEFVSTDISSLCKKLVGYGTIFVLDSSFVETSEQFLKLGKSNSDTSGIRSLVLVPYCCLKQLASTIEQGKDIVSFDTALREANQAESFIASQRLRSLFAFVTAENKSTKARVLHFSECLLAHTLAAAAVGAAGIDPGQSDNDHLLLVLAMIRAVAPRESNVVLCTDDTSLVRRLRDGELASIFAGEIHVMSSEPPQGIVEKEEALINDNPDFCVSVDFQPKLDASIPTQRHTPGKAASVLDSALTPTMSTAWLDMLNEEEQTEVPLVAVNTTPTQSETKDEEAKLEHEKLMNMYESEHAVAPVGVLMSEASSLGSVFEQFDTLGPDAEMDRDMSAAAAPQQEPGRRKDRPRKWSLLEVEAVKNRGASNKQRFHLARRLSNASGGRVPFNFRYRVLEVDIRDRRNKFFKDAYTEGVAKKRENFKRKFEASHLVGSLQP